MIQYILLALLRWLAMAAIRLLAFIPGLVIVPIALIWRYEDTSYIQKQPITWQDWRYIRLPRWAWMWPLRFISDCVELYGTWEGGVPEKRGTQTGLF